MDTQIVGYTLQNSGDLFEISFPTGKTVGDFIAALQAKHAAHYTTLFYDGAIATPDDEFDGWYDGTNPFELVAPGAVPKRDVPAPAPATPDPAPAPSGPPSSFLDDHQNPDESRIGAQVNMDFLRLKLLDLLKGTFTLYSLL
jgi:hypothetical protein